MLKNYLLVALRNLRRNKVFSFINLLGLALGMICSLLILLWVTDERSYDGFHPNGSSIYRVMVHNKDKDGHIGGSMDATSGLLADQLKKEVPEIAAAATVIWDHDQLFSVGNKTLKEKGRAAGADFFTVFRGFPLLQGDPATVLSSPDNIVISHRTAEKYFGTEDPIGKRVRIDDRKDFQVSGVVADVPENSSIKFDFVIPVKNVFDEVSWMTDPSWRSFGPPTYVMLRPGASVNKVNAILRNFLERRNKVNTDKEMSLQPYQDMYLYGNFNNGVPDGGRISYVRLFSIVAAFILLIACANFMNLTTARSAKRAREVGVRKVVGAARMMLFAQFIGEAVLLAFLSVLVALPGAYLLLGPFNSLTGKHLILPLHDPLFFTGVAGVTLLTGVIAGSYPALFLSSLNPMKVLKSQLQLKSPANYFRNGLIVFQFVLSILLIVCTTVIYRQMKYLQTKDLGLNRENIVYIPMSGELSPKAETFRNALLRSGTVSGLSQSSSLPTNVGMATEDVSWPGKDPSSKASFWRMTVGYDFTKTMQIALLAGRDFSKGYGADSSNFLINETAARMMKLEDPVGKIITYQGREGTIIGVMKDFHIRSLHEPISPLFVSFQPAGQFSLTIARIRGGSTHAFLDGLEKSWKKYNPRYPVEYLFADDSFRQQYNSEMLVEKLSDIFTALAILISCLGLFGLSSFVAEQRTKEIGIRKVLGASVGGIVGMLSKDFVKLILLSAFIAFPLGWWAMQEWLKGFAFRVPVGVEVFAFALGSSLLIALLTVSFQAVKAGVANPVKSLRSE
jgi:putative ABC transport system permease protein